jgi:nucleoside-diphosphate-sugar epimerase
MFGEEPIHDLRADPHFELITGDFRNLEAIARTIRGMDAVIHLGAIVGDPACALDQEVTLSVNTHAVRMIRALCRGFGVRRFLFASTCSVYGAQAELIHELSPLAPVSLYAQSKIDAEQAILEEKGDGFHPTILRLATAFGLSHRMRFDLVVNLLTAQALSKGKITIFNGHQWRPFIHVQDIARAFVACLEAPIARVSGQVFNAGDDRYNLTLRELGEVIARVVPGTEVCAKNNSSDLRSYRVDFSRIATALGFHCQVSVERGIEEMAAAIRAGKFPEFEHVRYHNAAYMKSLSGRSWFFPPVGRGFAARMDEPNHNGSHPNSHLHPEPPGPKRENANSSEEETGPRSSTVRARVTGT